jgi:ADP-heptose:LPS heptosyltransferase
MRILASNPDTLGDMVLRQPMYRALADAGHELLLVVRPSVAPLVRHVAPGASTLLLPAEVYAGDDAGHWA